MALDGSRLANTLYGTLSSKGMVGPKLMNFCNSVGIGSVLHVVGKPFTSTPNVVGPASGISGYDTTTCQNTIYAQCGALFGSFGPRLMDFCEAIAEGFTIEFGNATLTASTPDKPFGDLVVGSIGVDPAGWASIVTSTGIGYGMLGSHWPLMCTAIGLGGVAGMATATGVSILYGSGSIA